MDTGNLEKTLFLYNADETPHTGHLGGLTVSREAGMSLILMKICFNIRAHHSM
ncbi:MAG: hypothetical protein JEZ04_00395 [Spirochaetales bacterium]|nr:hypothetical protein [Spirochaetales bacterium]